MRRTIVVAVMTLVLAGAAMAVPAGPGGTLYIVGPYVSANTGQSIWTINLNADWDTVDSDGNVITTDAATQLDFISTTAASANVNFWPTTTNDMGGQYGNASLLLAYNTGSGNAYDYVTRDADGTYTTLWGATGAGYNTAYGGHLLVGSGFLPGGESDGDHGLYNRVSTSGTSRGIVWTDADSDGAYVGTNTPLSYSYENAATKYADLNQYAGNDYTVNGKLVTGAVVDIKKSSGSGAAYPNMSVVYRHADGTYTEVDMFADRPSWDHDGDPGTANQAWPTYVWREDGVVFVPPTVTGGNANYIGTTAGFAAADVTGNGALDVYYSASASDLYHATDLDGDGDWMGTDESWQIWGSTSARMNDLALVQVALPDAEYKAGHWVLLQWQRSTSMSYATRNLQIFTLDQNGDLVPGDYKIIASYYNGTGDQSLEVMGTSLGSSNSYIGFMPLNALQVPEPGTMLLVGSGILGLVGTLRRRFLH